MVIELSPLQVIMLILAIIGTLGGGARWLFERIDSSITSELKTLKDGHGEQSKEINRIEIQHKDQVNKIERDLLTLRAELPRDYVSRTDFVRSFTVVEAKLDALSAKLETTTIIAKTGQGAKQ